MQENFLIMGMARTGSTYLWSLLKTHPSIDCFNDDLCEEFKKNNLPLRVFLNSKFNNISKKIGTKILPNFYDEFTTEDFIWLKEVKNFKKAIYIYRENVLDQYVSLQLAQLNNAFTSYQLKNEIVGIYKSQSIKIEPKKLLHWHEYYKQTNIKIMETIKAIFGNYVSIEYNELKNQRKLKTIYSYLNVPYIHTESKQIKQKTKTNKEIIENYQELKTELTGTELEAYFND